MPLHLHEDWKRIVAWNGLARVLDKLSVLIPVSSLGPDIHNDGGAKGLEVSLCRFFQDHLVQIEVSYQSLQASVFFLQILELLGLTDTHSAILFAPSIIRLLSHAEPAADLGNRFSLGQKNFCFTQLGDNLFWCVLSDAH